MDRSPRTPPSPPSPTHHRSIAPPIARAERPAPVDPSPACLSRRQRAVVAALCEGLDRAAVAERIRRSQSTCDKAISGLYRTTGFATAHQVVAWAFRVGLCDPSPRAHGGRDA